MFHDFDLNLLVYLDSLLAAQSVSKAAARSHITQSAMSLALTRLRKHFQDELLVPIAGRKMAMTPLAESLIVPVREAIMKIDAVKKTVVDFDPAVSSREFTIDASSEVIDVILHNLLPRLTQSAPGIQLVVNSLRDEQMAAKHDMVIAPQKLFAGDVYTLPLWNDEWVCVTWTSNQLIGEELTLQQYTELGYVFSAADKHYSDASNVVRRMEVFVPETSMIPSALIGTNRIAILNLRQAEIYAHYCSLRLVALPVKVPGITEYMQWHHSQSSDPGAAWFRNFVKAAVQEE
jgi:LysR family transcriptional regulator, nod-box dependent transcriptional activator